MSEPRMYGNIWFNRPKSVGPISLSAAVVAGGSAFFGLVLMAISGRLGLGVLGLVAVLLVPAALKDRWGRSWWSTWWSKARFNVAALQGHSLYQSGPFSSNGSDTCDLPGIAGALRLVSGVDSEGSEFAVVVNKDGDVTVPLAAFPDGTSMLTRAETDRVVGSWSSALSNLGFQEGLVGVGVHTESVSGVGRDLVEEIEDQVLPDSPQLVIDSAKQLSEILGQSAPQHRAWIALTFSKGKGYRGSVKTKDRIADISSRLPKLLARLGAGCNGTVETITSEAFCWDIYRSLHPAKTRQIDQAIQAGRSIGFDQVGPLTALERADYYEHDATVSRSWVWGEPPMGEFFDDVLHSLTRPLSSVGVLRSSQLFRPVARQDTRKTVKALLAETSWKAKNNEQVEIGDQLEVNASKRVALEVTQGAALYRCGLIVTVSDTNTGEEIGERLDRLSQAVNGNLGSNTLQFRPSDRQQATHFFAGTPLGIVLDRHRSRLNKWEQYV